MAHWAEVTIHGAEGSGGDCDKSLLRTTGQRAASSCWGENARVEEKESEGVPHGERRDQVPFRKHRKGPRGEVETARERQQNSNRKSEEGL